MVDPLAGLHLPSGCVLLYLGLIPTVLVVAFIVRPGERRLRLWWLGSSASFC